MAVNVNANVRTKNVYLYFYFNYSHSCANWNLKGTENVVLFPWKKEPVSSKTPIMTCYLKSWKIKPKIWNRVVRLLFGSRRAHRVYVSVALSAAKINTPQLAHSPHTHVNAAMCSAIISRYRHQSQPSCVQRGDGLLTAEIV